MPVDVGVRSRAAPSSPTAGRSARSRESRNVRVTRIAARCGPRSTTSMRRGGDLLALRRRSRPRGPRRPSCAACRRRPRAGCRGRERLAPGALVEHARERAVRRRARRARRRSRACPSRRRSRACSAALAAAPTTRRLEARRTSSAPPGSGPAVQSSRSGRGERSGLTTSTPRRSPSPAPSRSASAPSAGPRSPRRRRRHVGQLAPRRPRRPRGCSSPAGCRGTRCAAARATAARATPRRPAGQRASADSVSAVTRARSARRCSYLVRPCVVSVPRWSSRYISPTQTGSSRRRPPPRRGRKNSSTRPKRWRGSTGKSASSRAPLEHLLGRPAAAVAVADGRAGSRRGVLAAEVPPGVDGGARADVAVVAAVGVVEHVREHARAVEPLPPEEVVREAVGLGPATA